MRFNINTAAVEKHIINFSWFNYVPSDNRPDTVLLNKSEPVSGPNLLNFWIEKWRVVNPLG
jgi:hypothetical protein